MAENLQVPELPEDDIKEDDDSTKQSSLSFYTAAR